MAIPLTSLFRIFGKNGQPVGAGFVVSEKLGLTCLHVVAAACSNVELGAEITLDFPHLSSSEKRIARLIFRDALSDTVGLEFDTALAPEVQPVALVAGPELWGHSFRAFGFPSGYPNGVWTDGRILEKDANGLLQIEETKTSGYTVQPGFSGAAIWDETLDGVVGMVTAADTRPGVRTAFGVPVSTLARVWDALRVQSIPAHPEVREAPTPGPSPYMGMRYFDTADAGLFFGRETLSQELAARLGKEHFLAVVGASGSGKSSLVRAGLVPIWQRGIDTPAGRLSGPVYLLTPSPHPLENLAASLTQYSESVTATTTLMDDLAKDPRSLHLYVRKLLNRSGEQHLLLVIDQFEETFTLCKDLAERRAFIENLMYAVTEDRSGALRVVLTLRADFYHRCAEYDGLRSQLKKHQEYIGAMSAAELRQAIETPAFANGWSFEPGLVDLILHDVGAEPGALPLLSHALLETWNQRQGRTLTLAGYTAAGGVRKAIARTAERVYQSLDPAQRGITQNIFLRLTELGEGVQDTRRRVSLQELAFSTDPTVAVEPVLTLLADARLITTGQDWVEVAHEALIREWPTLRAWLDENREGLRLHRHLTETAQEWARREKDPDELYKGARLLQAQEWAEQSSAAINPLEQEFLDVSLEAARKEEAEREERQRRELEQVRRLARIQRQRSIVLGIGLGIAIVLVGVSAWFYRQAQENLKLATYRQIAVQAQSFFSMGNEKQMIAVQLAAFLMHLSPSSEVARILQDNILMRPINRMTNDDPVDSVVLSPDGKILVTTGSWSKIIRVWEVFSGREIAKMPHDDLVSSVVFSPDGKFILSASRDKTARVWKISSGEEVSRMTHDDPVNSVAFNPDGKTVVSGSSDKTARVWDVTDGREIFRVAHEDGVSSVAFSSDGEMVASGSYDGTVRLWKTANGIEIAKMSEPGLSVVYVVFSPDGKFVISTDTGGLIRVWGVADGKKIIQLPHGEVSLSATFSPNGEYMASRSGGVYTGATIYVWRTSNWELITNINHGGQVHSLAFSPDSKTIVTGSGETIARIWNVINGKEIARVTHTSPINSVAFGLDGKTIVLGSEDGVIQIWKMGDKGIVEMRHNHFVSSASFSPDGKTVASGSVDGTVHVWDVTSGKEITWMHYDSYVKSVVFSPDGKTVVSSNEDNTIHVWEISSGKEITRMVHDNSISSVTFSPDGKYVASGSYDNTARVWEVFTGKEIARMTHDSYVSSVAFSPDGKKVASGSDDGTARVWDVINGKEIARITCRNHVSSVAFSPNGTTIVSGSRDGTVNVWEAVNGTILAQMNYDIAVDSVAFSPDGKFVVSSNYNIVHIWKVASGKEIVQIYLDGTVTVADINLTDTRNVSFGPDGKAIVFGKRNTVYVWDANSGREISRMSNDVSAQFVAFSPDGKTVISGDGNIVRIWLWRPEDLINQACTYLPRNLTYAEWQLYIGDVLPYQVICPNLPLEPKP
jgi:WD40 repeat protein